LTDGGGTLGSDLKNWDARFLRLTSPTDVSMGECQEYVLETRVDNEIHYPFGQRGFGLDAMKHQLTKNT
jgi:hypothetical protein